jgi:WD40 repeat protein
VTARALATQLTSRACDSVSSVAFNASGSTLAVGCDHGSVLLWTMVTRDVTTVLAAHGAGGLIAVAFSQDDRKVAAVDEGCRLYLWDVATGHLKVILQGVDSIAFSPDGRTLAAGSTDGRVYRWSLSGHLIATRTDPDSAGVRSVAFSPDGSTIAVGDSIGTTYLWHAN